jgi:flagellar motor switch/type III secretory pathway protein FliN
MNEPIPLQSFAAKRRNAMIDEAHVQVVVSFPAITLSVAEAGSLREGYVIDLGVSLANAKMAVKISGDDVGEGELILVESNAAVVLFRV